MTLPNTTMSLDELAYLIDAEAKRSDPITRFIDGLSADLKREAMDTVWLRDEYVHHATAVLQAGINAKEAMAHAQWLHENATLVAHRWSSLLGAAIRFNETSVDMFRQAKGKAP